MNNLRERAQDESRRPNRKGRCDSYLPLVFMNLLIRDDKIISKAQLNDFINPYKCKLYQKFPELLIDPIIPERIGNDQINNWQEITKDQLERAQEWKIKSNANSYTKRQLEGAIGEVVVYDYLKQLDFNTKITTKDFKHDFIFREYTVEVKTQCRALYTLNGKPNIRLSYDMRVDDYTRANDYESADIFIHVMTSGRKNSDNKTIPTHKEYQIIGWCTQPYFYTNCHFIGKDSELEKGQGFELATHNSRALYLYQLSTLGEFEKYIK